MKETKKTLPLLKDMILPSCLTIFRRIKISKAGIFIQKEFKDVEIDKISLEKYKEFFNWNEESPLSFFYLMAQRAQTSLMLDANFTIPIPGLVHISNKLEQICIVDYSLPFDLKVTVNVQYKEENSLIPKFVVCFIQNNKSVIVCESTYLAKRKSSGSNKINIGKTISTPNFSEIWEIPENLGRLYANASGDKNPIHFSTIFAKLTGFKSPILQGWYGVSRIIREYEEKTKLSFSTIEVDFKSPILLPSNQKVDIQESTNGELYFQVTNTINDKIVMSGKLK